LLGTTGTISKVMPSPWQFRILNPRGEERGNAARLEP
jgi:hypothetical protein